MDHEWFTAKDGLWELIYLLDNLRIDTPRLSEEDIEEYVDLHFRPYKSMG